MTGSSLYRLFSTRGSSLVTPQRFHLSFTSLLIIDWISLHASLKRVFIFRARFCLGLLQIQVSAMVDLMVSFFAKFGLKVSPCLSFQLWVCTFLYTSIRCVNSFRRKILPSSNNLFSFFFWIFQIQWSYYFKSINFQILSFFWGWDLHIMFFFCTHIGTHKLVHFFLFVSPLFIEFLLSVCFKKIKNLLTQ